jgi:hypothetical protein
MKKIMIALVAATVLYSCRENKQVDVKEPVIESVLLDGIETTSIVRQAGTTILVDVNVSDNTELNQLQLNLHAAWDGHVHDGDGHPGGEERLTSGTWAKNEVINISGTNKSHQFELNIPDTVAGNWHIMITALDEIGLVSRTYTALITVENVNLPVISCNTSPMYDATQTITTSPGTQLFVSGLAEDPTGLKNFWVRIANYSGASTDTLTIPIVGDGYSMAFNSASFYVPGIGKYRVIIEAQDSMGYKGLWDAKLLVQ